MRVEGAGDMVNILRFWRASSGMEEGSVKQRKEVGEEFAVGGGGGGWRTKWKNKFGAGF